MKAEVIINLKEEFKKIIMSDVMPDCLYHYTSIEGFKGIIDSREIWATAAHCLLNDPTEITTAREITLKILEERKKDFNKRGFYDICVKKIEDWTKMKEDTFVCSLTEKEDLLSQWRAYCPKGGVSIGFSVPEINEKDQYIYSSANNYYAHENYLYKCIYYEQKQRQKVNEIFNLFLSQKYESITADSLSSFLWNAMRFFSYSFKHISFEEEQEWRLCRFGFNEPIQYRVKDSMLMPYLSFRIVDRNGHSIVKSVKIGPSRNKEDLRKSILSYLKSSGYQPGRDISVSVTETPYQNL